MHHKKHSSFIIFALAFAVLLGLSSLGSAQYLSQDAGGMIHMSWSPITANPLPSTGVQNVLPTTDGSFVATVQNAATGESDYYSLNPSNRSAGWTKVDTCPTWDVNSPLQSSLMPFAFGPNGFGTDTIALPDAGYFTTSNSKGYPFFEMMIYHGNLIKYAAATASTAAFYHIHAWPITDTLAGTPVDSSDARFPLFQTSSVFYAFVGSFLNSYEFSHCFYIASALETKSQQYFSLVISYGTVNMGTTSAPIYNVSADVVADPIAPAGEVIVAVAASPQWTPSRGYVAVAADGTSYFANP